MPKAFDSPKFLVSQTRENLAEFDKICSAVLDSEGQANVVDIDPQTGNKSYKVKFNKSLPGRARHIVATAINDFRHSLDQATCDAVRLVTKADPGLIYFPFATHPNDLEARLKKSVPVPLHAVFSSFQPYPAGKGYVGGNNLLAALGSSAGPNKHQVTCGIAGRIVNFHAHHIEATGGVVYMAMPPRRDPEANEMVIGIVKPDGHIHYEFDMTFFEVIQNAGKLSGAPALFTLKKLAEIAEKIITDPEAETVKLAA